MLWEKKTFSEEIILFFQNRGIATEIIIFFVI